MVLSIAYYVHLFMFTYYFYTQIWDKRPAEKQWIQLSIITITFSTNNSRIFNHFLLPADLNRFMGYYWSDIQINKHKGGLRWYHEFFKELKKYDSDFEVSKANVELNGQISNRCPEWRLKGNILCTNIHVNSQLDSKKLRIEDYMKKVLSINKK